MSAIDNDGEWYFIETKTIVLTIVLVNHDVDISMKCNMTFVLFCYEVQYRVIVTQRWQK